MFRINLFESDIFRAQQGRFVFSNCLWIWGLRLEHAGRQRWGRAGREPRPSCDQQQIGSAYPHLSVKSLSFQVEVGPAAGRLLIQGEVRGMVIGGALKTVHCAAGPDAQGGAEEVDMEDGVGASWGDDLDLEPKGDADELDEDMIANGDEEAEDGEGGWEMEVPPSPLRLHSNIPRALLVLWWYF